MFYEINLECGGRVLVAVEDVGDAVHLTPKDREIIAKIMRLEAEAKEDKELSSEVIG